MSQNESSKGKVKAVVRAEDLRARDLIKAKIGKISSEQTQEWVKRLRMDGVDTTDKGYRLAPKSVRREYEKQLAEEQSRALLCPKELQARCCAAVQEDEKTKEENEDVRKQVGDEGECQPQKVNVWDYLVREDEDGEKAAGEKKGSVTHE